MLKRASSITYLTFLGLLVGGFALHHALEPGEPPLGKILSVSAILGIAVPLLGSAYWLSSHDFEEPRVWRAVSWSFAGAFLLTCFAIITVKYQQSHGVYLADADVITVFVGGTGATAGILVGAYDLRSLNARDRSRTTADRLSTVFDASPVALIELAPDGTVKRWNPAAEQLSGWSAEEAVGQRLPLIPRAVEEHHDWEDIIGSERAVSGVETRCTTKDGEVVRCQLWTTPLEFENGNGTGTLAVVVDISEETRRRQQLSVVNRILRHNLRNTVNVISGNSNLLREEVSKADAAEKLDAITDSASRLAKLSEQAQDIQRIVSTGADSAGPSDVVAVLERLREELQREHPEARITMTAPTHAWTAAGSTIELAFREVIENAIEHSEQPEPSVDIEIPATGTESEPQSVVVNVSDDGPGIPDHERAVMEKGDETALEHSSGLGLWMVKWIMNQHGGTVEFAYSESRGSDVTLTLPAATQD